MYGVCMYSIIPYLRTLLKRAGKPARICTIEYLCTKYVSKYLPDYWVPHQHSLYPGRYSISWRTTGMMRKGIRVVGPFCCPSKIKLSFSLAVFHCGSFCLWRSASGNFCAVRKIWRCRTTYSLLYSTVHANWWMEYLQRTWYLLTLVILNIDTDRYCGDIKSSSMIENKDHHSFKRWDARCTMKRNSQ